MGTSKRIDPEEAFAFLNVVAPKLEQLRRRLVAANQLLKSGDPETARLDAIMESQIAIREFLGAIPHLSSLVDPIDALLEAVREEPEELPPPPGDLAPEPEPEPEPPPPSEATEETVPAPATPLAAAEVPAPPITDKWLEVGTVLAVQKLIAAGMSEASAELYVRDTFGAIKLSLGDASPITDVMIKAWRRQFTGTRRGWRGGSSLRRKASGGGVAAIAEAKKRVAEMAVTFKNMSDLGA